MNKYMGQGRPVKEQWTEAQTKFVELSVQGLNPTEAARQAGYAFPAVEGCKLLDNSNIRTAIMRGLRTRAATNVEWKQLIEEAKRVLHFAMSHGDVKESIMAASKCLDVATKIGEETLASKAQREDRMTSIQEEAEKSLGKVAVMMVPAEGQEEIEH